MPRRSGTLKDALGMAPMDQCTLPARSPSREWWRYGFAWGFLERDLRSVQAGVREKRFRDALAIGFDVGTKARVELDAGGVGV